MRSLRIEELDDVSGGLDSTEMCTYMVIGGAIATLAGAALIFAAPVATSLVASGSMSMITAGTLMIGTAGRLTVTQSMIAGSAATLNSSLVSAGVVTSGGGTIVSAVGQLCEKYV